MPTAPPENNNNPSQQYRHNRWRLFSQRDKCHVIQCTLQLHSVSEGWEYSPLHNIRRLHFQPQATGMWCVHHQQSKSWMELIRYCLHYNLDHPCLSTNLAQHGVPKLCYNQLISMSGETDCRTSTIVNVYWQSRTTILHYTWHCGDQDARIRLARRILGL